LLSELLATVRAHRLVLPADMVLLLKMLVMNEGMAAQLDPDFVLAPAIAPFARGLVARRGSSAPVTGSSSGSSPPR
jgi:ubiquinone biosynthesis protein